jgi:hypothetical protein
MPKNWLMSAPANLMHSRSPDSFVVREKRSEDQDAEKRKDERDTREAMPPLRRQIQIVPNADQQAENFATGPILAPKIALGGVGGVGSWFAPQMRKALVGRPFLMMFRLV